MFGHPHQKLHAARETVVAQAHALDSCVIPARLPKKLATVPMSTSSIPPIPALADHTADPFRGLLDAIVDYAIYTVSPEKRIASWNPGAERIHGYHAE